MEPLKVCLSTNWFSPAIAHFVCSLPHMVITHLMMRSATKLSPSSRRLSLIVCPSVNYVRRFNLSAVVDYSSMVKQRSLGPDNLEDGTDPSSAFLDALRTRAMDEMHEAALEYGIVLKDLGKRGTF